MAWSGDEAEWIAPGKRKPLAMRTLITGASSGLGSEMARQFAGNGHDLVIAARRVNRLNVVRDEILAMHPARRVDVVPLDVRDERAVGLVFDRHKPLDRVIVNAGVGNGEPIGAGDPQTNREIVMINFLGALNQIEAAMAVFQAQGRGHLVVISSVAAIRGMGGGLAVYAATKRAVAHLAEGLRIDTLHTHIDITTVYPGSIRTEVRRAHVNPPFIADTEPAVRSMVRGIEKRRSAVYAPTLPWAPLSVVLRAAPIRLLYKITSPQYEQPG